MKKSPECEEGGHLIHQVCKSQPSQAGIWFCYNKQFSIQTHYALSVLYYRLFVFCPYMLTVAFSTMISIPYPMSYTVRPPFLRDVCPPFNILSVAHSCILSIPPLTYCPSPTLTYCPSTHIWYPVSLWEWLEMKLGTKLGTTAQPHKRTKVTSRGGAYLKMNLPIPTLIPSTKIVRYQ